MKEIETRIRQLQAGTLSRRSFMNLVAGLGLGATAAGSIEGAQVWTQMAARAGVSFKVTRVPADGFWDAIWRVKPFIVSQWNMRPTANSQLAIAFKLKNPVSALEWIAESCWLEA